MDIESVKTDFHLLSEDGQTRKLAYCQSGTLDAKHVFLCLPGLLETCESFLSLFKLIEHFDECCWISIDYCGRGQSDNLTSDVEYAVSLYLSDVEKLIEHLIFRQEKVIGRQIHLIGTSMGGILAMHLVKRHPNQFASLVLNDIGLHLHWSSLLSLYRQIQRSDEKIEKLKVDQRAIQAVQRSSHYDLPYAYDFIGMRFDALLNQFNGQTILIHNEDSPICSKHVALQSQSQLSKLIVWPVNQTGHPVQWEHHIVAKLGQLIQLKSKPTASIRPQFADAFMATSSAYLHSKAIWRRNWFKRWVYRLRICYRSYT